MRVWHYLFFVKNNKITSVLKKDNGFEILRFGGNISVEYNEDFWNMWQEYAGFIKNDLIDFCFIYDDEKPQVSEYLKVRECSTEDCKWNKYFIQDAVNLLDIKFPAVILNVNGVCIAKSGKFTNKKEDKIVRLTADYRNSDAAILEDESEEAEITPFIEEMLGKLKEYDEEG